MDKQGEDSFVRYFAIKQVSLEKQTNALSMGIVQKERNGIEKRAFLFLKKIGARPEKTQAGEVHAVDVIRMGGQVQLTGAHAVRVNANHVSTTLAGKQDPDADQVAHVEELLSAAHQFFHFQDQRVMPTYAGKSPGNVGVYELLKNTVVVVQQHTGGKGYKGLSDFCRIPWLLVTY
jgi:hypothetical protein